MDRAREKQGFSLCCQYCPHVDVLASHVAVTHWQPRRLHAHCAMHSTPASQPTCSRGCTRSRMLHDACSSPSEEGEPRGPAGAAGPALGATPPPCRPGRGPAGAPGLPLPWPPPSTPTSGLGFMPAGGAGAGGLGAGAGGCGTGSSEGGGAGPRGPDGRTDGALGWTKGQDGPPMGQPGGGREA